MRIEPMLLSTCLAMAHRRNPKDHDIDGLTDSFVRFGFTAPPMIDEATETMVAGHGRCEALERMRYAGQRPPTNVEVAPDGVDWLVPIIRDVSFKSERERDAYVIADNQHVMAGGWKFDVLSELLAELQDDGGFEGLGFAEVELQSILEHYGEEKVVPDLADEGRDIPVDGHTRHIGGHKVRPPAQMTNADWTIHVGDCLEGMRALEPASVDAVVTDPPAGISFMGKAWDDDKGGRDKWIAWLQSVMTEALRILKPGGHILAWALPRTSHWTAMAIENAGFEIRDVVYHAFGTGYPKSLNISKAIDAHLGVEREVIGEQVAFNKLPLSDLKERATAPLLGGPATEEAAQWDGWGTALKPAVEPWILGRKPLDGSVAESVLKHGVGGINIDECRVGSEERFNPSASSMYSMGEKPMEDAGGTTARGRWPAHLVLSHSEGCKPTGTVEDSRLTNVGERIGDGSRTLEFGMGKMTTTTTTTTTTTYECVPECAVRLLDEQGPDQDTELGVSRFFYVAKPSKAETEAGLDHLEPVTGGEATGRGDGSVGVDNPRAGAGRGGGRRNFHPTKKPIELMRLLVRLITPIGGLVADPFAGSGTTGLGALAEGCRFVGWELSSAYHEIASARLRSFIEDPRTIEEPTAPDSEDAEEAYPEEDPGNQPPFDGLPPG